MGIWKIKLTGKIPALKKSVLQFLGRTIYRERDGESSLSLGVSEAHMVGIMDSWYEKLKPTEVPPKLEDLVKSKEKEGEVALTQEGEVRYRRVLGQLAWAALSRADLCFYVSRYQSKPNAAAEACLRAVLRWLLTRLHRVQVMPSPEGSPPSEPCVLIEHCDASWNVSRALHCRHACPGDRGHWLPSTRSSTMYFEELDHSKALSCLDSLD
eukprot:s5850_g3.t1